jgi:glycosyltransferase involved in cell wall biosynthesis
MPGKNWKIGINTTVTLTFKHGSSTAAMDRGPRTTVIIPVLNGEAHIRRALESVLFQLDDCDEILVVDDRSIDRTRSLVQSYQPRVSVLQGLGRGQSAARNVGLAAATGELIAFLDHDDEWPRGRHETLSAALRTNSAANAAVGRVRMQIDAGGDGSRFVKLEGSHDASILMSCLFRRQLIDRVGTFNEHLRFGEDVDYYWRLIGAGMVSVVCDVDGLIYRRHGSNATNACPDRMVIVTDILAQRLAGLRRQRGRQGPSA